MAKTNKASIQPQQKWQGSLPVEYTILTQGLSAYMQLKDLKKYIELQTPSIPQTYLAIPLVSYTPSVYDWDQRFFYQQVEIKNEALKWAMADPDVQKVQAEHGIVVDLEKPTLAAVVSTIQTVHAGYYAHMAEMASSTMFARLQKIKEPRFLDKLRNSKFVKDNKIKLPEKVPYFEFDGQQFSVKSVSSALGKAYNRTGQVCEHDKDDFYNQSKKYGLNGVTDTLRTKLKVHRKGMSKEDHAQAYDDLQTILTVAFVEGKLGMVADREITDSVYYPESDRPSDLMPVGMFKGTFYRVGPNNTYFKLAMEIQVKYMDNDADLESRRLYEQKRSTKDPAELADLDRQRVFLFERPLTDKLKATRALFLATGMPPADDPLGALILTGQAVKQAQSRGAENKAKQFAYDEYQLDDRWKNNKGKAEQLVAGRLPASMIDEMKQDITQKGQLASTTPSVNATLRDESPNPVRLQKYTMV